MRDFFKSFKKQIAGIVAVVVTGIALNNGISAPVANELGNKAGEAVERSID